MFNATALRPNASPLRVLGRTYREKTTVRANNTALCGGFLSFAHAKFTLSAKFACSAMLTASKFTKVTFAVHARKCSIVLSFITCNNPFVDGVSAGLEPGPKASEFAMRYKTSSMAQDIVPYFYFIATYCV